MLYARTALGVFDGPAARHFPNRSRGRWIGSAENLQAAKALIKAKSGEQPGDFLVVSLETGWKMEIKAPGTAA
jgi:hypothetical protein